MKNRISDIKRMMGFKTETHQKNTKIILRDFLAIDRTRLANQRTLLSFLRTGLYLFVTALAVMKVGFLNELQFLGNVFIGLSVITTIVGIVNYFMMRRKIEKHYRESPSHFSDN